jgi:hypothetical protein
MLSPPSWLLPAAASTLYSQHTLLRRAYVSALLSLQITPLPELKPDTYNVFLHQATPLGASSPDSSGNTRSTLLSRFQSASTYTYSHRKSYESVCDSHWLPLVQHNPSGSAA